MRGRPKGSKNKTTLKDEALEIKKENTSLLNEKEVKREIRKLKKLKLACRAGSVERIDLEHKIKALKKQRIEITTVEPGKEKLIADILRLEIEQKTIPRFIDLGIDLHIYTIEQLEYHLKRIRGVDRKQ